MPTFTTNGLSTSPAQTFTTAQLYDLVEPVTGPLFGLEAGNPVDTEAAYKGPQRRWGTANDRNRCLRATLRAG